MLIVFNEKIETVLITSQYHALTLGRGWVDETAGARESVNYLRIERFVGNTRQKLFGDTASVDT